MSSQLPDPGLPAVNPSPATYPFLEPQPSSAGSTPWPSRPGSAASSGAHSRQSPGSFPLETEPTKSTSHRAPALSSVMPRFEGPDLNLLLWIFSWRYRRLLGQWNTASIQDRRVNWAGMALSSFYSALRRALIISIILRTLVVAGGLATGIAWLTKRYRDARISKRLA